MDEGWNGLNQTCNTVRLNWSIADDDFDDDNDNLDHDGAHAVGDVFVCVSAQG